MCIRDRGDKKELVTQEDLPYIVSDVLKHGVVSESVKLKSYIVTLAHGLKPMGQFSLRRIRMTAGRLAARGWESRQWSQRRLR